MPAAAVWIYSGVLAQAALAGIAVAEDLERAVAVLLAAQADSAAVRRVQPVGTLLASADTALLLTGRAHAEALLAALASVDAEAAALLTHGAIGTVTALVQAAAGPGAKATWYGIPVGPAGVPGEVKLGAGTTPADTILHATFWP